MNAPDDSPMSEYRVFAFYPVGADRSRSTAGKTTSMWFTQYIESRRVLSRLDTALASRNADALAALLEGRMSDQDVGFGRWRTVHITRWSHKRFDVIT